MKVTDVLWILGGLAVALIGITLVAVTWGSATADEPRKYLVAIGVGLALVSLAAAGIERIISKK